ncbi:FAD-dependent oxidoreductase [Kribbella sp. NPDC050470]|uniref:FAD-dependent oxidoreductase n=1 Tax=unclassified Kribbella TaxID=2644121 RepID=UPI0037BDF9BB
MTPKSVEVVVVGGGPVGLAAATGLRLRGHSVVVVDKQAEGSNTSRASVIHARTLEMLERIGVTKRLVELGLELQDFAIRDGDRRLVPVSFRDLPTDYPFTLMIPQWQTEQILLERLEELGGTVLRPYSATGLTQSADGAEVTLDNGDVIQAQYVVAADGMHSTIRELAGLQMPGNTLQLNFSLVDVRADGLPAEEVSLSFATAGLLVIAPLPDGSFRLVASVDKAPEHPDLAYAQQLLSARGPRKTAPVVTEVIWGSRFRIHERVAENYRAGRVLLAGDAAHTHSPAGGQGMNLGLRDAIALAEALSTAIGNGDESELDAYAATSRTEALRVVGLAHRLTRLANVPRPVRPLRNAVLGLVGRLNKTQNGLAKQLAGIPDR